MKCESKTEGTWLVIVHHLKAKKIDMITVHSGSDPLEKHHFTTVPAPLKGAPYIQKLFFGPSDYHIKNS